MKKKLALLLILLLFGTIGYLSFTRYFIPKIVVSTLTKNDSTNFLLPKSIKVKINKAKKKVVPLADSLIYEAHRQGLNIDVILNEIDKLDEQQVYSFHDMLKARTVKNADELFDMAKSAFRPDFNVEPFRPIFKANFTFAKYNELLEKADKMRENPLYDFETSKIIARQLVLDREEQFNSTIRKVESEIQ